MQQDDKAYWDLVDALIEQANRSAEEIDPGLAASALMHAAARFCAFYAASSSESRNDLKEDKDSLVQDFSREFKKQFANNLEDYIDNYKVYLGQENHTSH